MIRHIVLFAFKDELPPAKQQEALGRFRALKGLISDVGKMEDGVNISNEGMDQGLTHCFLMDFADTGARDRYLVHPSHKDFVGYIVPLCKNAIIADFEPGRK